MTRFAQYADLSIGTLKVCDTRSASQRVVAKCLVSGKRPCHNVPTRQREPAGVVLGVDHKKTRWSDHEVIDIGL